MAMMTFKSTTAEYHYFMGKESSETHLSLTIEWDLEQGTVTTFDSYLLASAPLPGQTGSAANATLRALEEWQIDRRPSAGTSTVRLVNGCLDMNVYPAAA
jgi:hypothetical protein